MLLPVFKQLARISPSQFMSWENCQYKTYITRLAGFEYIRSAPGMAACIGSAFDAYIKDYIAKKRGEQTIMTDVSYLINRNIPKDMREEATSTGRMIAEIYIRIGLADELISKTIEVELERELFTIHENVPILGQLDAIIDRSIPLDWKTRGFAGKYPAYATGGWCRRIDYDFSKDKVVKSIKYPDDKGAYHLESTRKSWVIQQMFYTLLLKQRVEPKFIIHEIARHKDIISFAIHKSQVSIELYKEQWPRVQAMWDAITANLYTAEIEEPEPHVRKCMMYNTLCEAASRCKFYENTLGNPDPEMSGEHWT